jgi:septal ring factor EnvC (AmiA/AmiB activator)
MRKILISLFLPLFITLNAGDDNKAQLTDMQALAKRFDAEAKPYFTVDKSTTFVKVDGGFTYLPEGSLVPVLDNVMKVNGFFCSKATSGLAEASGFAKSHEAAAAELSAYEKKIDDTRQKADSLEDDLKDLEKRFKDLKKSMVPGQNKDAKSNLVGQLNLDMGNKRNDLTDARRDLKKLEKDIVRKKEIREELKKKADAVKTAQDAFLENQKRLTSKTGNSPEVRN